MVFSSSKSFISFCLDDSHDVVIYETLDFYGGQWVYVDDDSPSVHSSCYKNMLAATPKKTMEYSHFPMSDKYPNLCTWRQVLDYIDEYVAHFNLERVIKYKHRVLSVEPLPENKWKVIVQVNGDKIEEHEYDAVAVCNGHHSDPYYPPNMTGRESFKGKLIHSHTYRTPGFASGKKVIVAGMGISGGDISEDIKVHGNALQIIRCTRRIEKFQRPDGEEPDYGFVGSALVKVSDICGSIPGLRRVGDAIRYWGEHSGWISLEKEIYKPWIKHIEENAVVHVDGSRTLCDAVVLCTGFNFDVPFLPKSIIDELHVQQDPVVLQLYKHTLLPKYPTLAFIGCMQVSGSLHPPAEKQSEWFNELLSGRCKLPTPSEMQNSINSWITEYKAKKAVRPFMVNQNKYMMDLESMIKAGLRPEEAPMVLQSLQEEKVEADRRLAEAKAAEFRAKMEQQKHAQATSSPLSGATESKKDK